MPRACAAVLGRGSKVVAGTEGMPSARGPAREAAQKKAQPQLAKPRPRCSTSPRGASRDITPSRSELIRLPFPTELSLEVGRDGVSHVRYRAESKRDHARRLGLRRLTGELRESDTETARKAQL